MRTRINYQKKFNKAISKAQKYIEIAKEYDIEGIEPDSTWENGYDFKSVTMTERGIKLIYRTWETTFHGISVETKKEFMYFSQDEYRLEDIRFTLSWITRSITKGFKEAGMSISELI